MSLLRIKRVKKKMNKVPNHLAIILDGNGRWAKKRGMPRNFGHYQGGRNLFVIANEAMKIGIKILTVYAFSTENWKRPKEEIDYLMGKPLEFLNENEHRLSEIKYQIKFVGRRDRVPNDMKTVIERLESETKNNEGMLLQVAFDYGSKEELVQAFNKLNKPFKAEDIQNELYVKQDVDLLIRTSGEERLSNFLLWQVAYAEFLFVKKHWPAFNKRDLAKAIKIYQKRNRRFGGL
ncbi:MAG: polyprenyl diphosphate synthase [Acholeplasma sp.]|nr:polyprenyl diphosphate synthase [Acholeplasma sp.]